MRAQCLPLFLRGGWGGQQGLLGGAAPIVFQLLIQGTSLLVLSRILKSEWHSQAEDGPSFSLDSLRLERPDANGPGFLRAGPSGEEWCTPHHTVPVSCQCPQEIGLLILPVFQGAAVSSERFSQALPPRNVELDRSSPAGPPLQGTERAALSTPEASIERLFPLVGQLAVWEPLPSVSHWVLPEQTLVL